MAKAPAKKKAPTKTEVLNNIADATDLTKKQVAAVFEALADEIKKNLGNRGAGMFTIPGLIKVTKKRVSARAARYRPFRRPGSRRRSPCPRCPAHRHIPGDSLEP